MGFFSPDDKYQDRSWDWAKDFSKKIMPAFKDIFPQTFDATQAGELTPWNQATMGYAENALSPYTGNPLESDMFKRLESMYQPYMQQGGQNPFESDLYKGIEQLYQPTVEPLYNQMMDPLKRGIEGQYGNQVEGLLNSGVRGGALVDMLSRAGGQRATSLGDMEKQLRTQDILRLDQTQQARANALSQAAQNIYGQGNQAGLAATNALGNAGLGLNQQGMNANQFLSGLRTQLSADDVTRLNNWINTGIQGRYMTGNQLAGSEAAQGASQFGALTSMMSMLGMGMGQSGMFSGSQPSTTG